MSLNLWAQSDWLRRLDHSGIWTGDQIWAPYWRLESPIYQLIAKHACIVYNIGYHFICYRYLLSVLLFCGLDSPSAWVLLHISRRGFLVEPYATQSHEVTVRSNELWIVQACGLFPCSLRRSDPVIFNLHTLPPSGAAL